MKISDIIVGEKSRKLRGKRHNRINGNSLLAKSGKRAIKKLVGEDPSLGGKNAIPGSIAVPHEMMPALTKVVNDVLAKADTKALPIGSGATPIPGEVSGDIDLIVDADALKKHFSMEDQPDKIIRQKVKQLFDLAGFQTVQSGVSIHIGVKLDGNLYQADIMVVPNAENAAQFHTHNIPKGSPYKGTNKHQMLSIIAREKGMLWSNYVGLFKRLPNGRKDPKGFITSDINKIAQLLLGPNAKPLDMGSVEAIVSALGDAGQDLLANIRATDPNWKEKS